MIAAILIFIRLGEKEVEPIHFHKIVEESLKVEALLLTTISIQMDMKKKRDIVLADPTCMTQMVMNLCTNAE